VTFNGKISCLGDAMGCFLSLGRRAALLGRLGAPQLAAAGLGNLVHGISQYVLIL
jgi:hypothetical protein